MKMTLKEHAIYNSIKKTAVRSLSRIDDTLKQKSNLFLRTSYHAGQSLYGGYSIDSDAVRALSETTH